MRLEIREALRLLRRSLFFTITSSLSLALGIGAFLLCSSALASFRVSRLPYPRSEQLVTLATVRGSQTTAARPGVRAETYRAIQSMRSIFTGSAVWGMRFPAPVEMAGVLKRVGVGYLSVGFEDVFRQHPILGRGFLPSDSVANAAPVALLSFELWHTAFSADSAVLGAWINIAGVRHLVIGVMPRGFDFPYSSRAWRVARVGDSARELNVIARLSDGVTLEEANLTLARLSESRLGDVARSSGAGVPSRVRAFELRKLYTLGESGSAIAGAATVAGVAVLLVLALASTNLLGLSLTRNLGRESSLAARTALGAQPSRPVRLATIESGSILLVSLALAIIGAYGAAFLLKSQLPLLPSWVSFSPNRYSITAALIVSVIVTVGIGAFVGSRVSRIDVTTVLAGGAHTVTSPKGLRRAQLSVTVLQLGLASSFLLMALWTEEQSTRIRRADSPTGSQQLAVGVLQPRTGGRLSLVSLLQQRVVPLLSAGPEVVSASAVQYENLAIENLVPSSEVQSGQPVSRSGAVILAEVGDGYFRTRPTRLLAGRVLGSEDLGMMTAVVDSTAARQLHLGPAPVGSQLRLRMPHAADTSTYWLDIVGVVESSRHEANASAQTGTVYARGIHATQWAAVYIALRPAGASNRKFLLPPRVGKRYEDGLAQLPADAAYAAPIESLESYLESPSSRLLRGAGVYFAFLTSVAILLGLIGFYAVVSIGWTQRRREFAIRSACGASPMRLIGSALHDALSAYAVGTALGALLAWTMIVLAKNTLGNVDDPSVRTLLVGAALPLGACCLAVSRLLWRIRDVDHNAILRSS